MANLTAEEVLESVRENIEDTIVPYRFSDDELLRELTTAARRLVTDRPDLMIDTDGTIIDESLDIDYIRDNLIFDRYYLDALVYYVCYLIFKKDSSDTYNATQSATHLASYMGAIN